MSILVETLIPEVKGEGGAFKGEVPGTNRKGRDIGYVPATSSCEEANSVDACTITALDVITAFAVPNPNGSSQSPSVFSGLGALQVALPNDQTRKNRRTLRGAVGVRSEGQMSELQSRGPLVCGLQLDKEKILVSQ